MTKKFTEEEYQKIVDCFDKLKKEYNMGILNPNVTLHFQEELFNDFDLVNDWQEIVAIMNLITRDWAHEQFVEKEKKYYWKYKKTDNGGKRWVLTNRYGIITTWCDTDDGYLEDYKKDETYLLSKKEVVEAGYNPDMFDKEEVD